MGLLPGEGQPEWAVSLLRTAVQSFQEMCHDPEGGLLSVAAAGGVAVVSVSAESMSDCRGC